MNVGALNHATVHPQPQKAVLSDSLFAFPFQRHIRKNFTGSGNNFFAPISSLFLTLLNSAFSVFEIGTAVAPSPVNLVQLFTALLRLRSQGSYGFFCRGARDEHRLQKAALQNFLLR